jgi:hypothetical protein
MFLQIVPALAAASALALVLVAAGARARRILRMACRPALRVPVDFLLGSWLLAAAVLVLGLGGLWYAWLLAAVTGAWALVGRWRRTGWRWATLLPPAAGALIALPLALGAPFFYDALVYHLGLPWQGLLERGLHGHPEDLLASFPPLAQLLAALPLAFGLDRAPAVLHWWSFVAAGAAAAALARTLGAPRREAALAAACLPVLPASALVAGLPASEGWAVAGILAALAVALSPRLRAGDATMAGLLAGIATATRLQGLPWSAMVLAVVVLRAPKRWRAGGRAVLGWLAGSSPWWFKNLVLLGDPAAPLLWRREGVATLWRDAGSVLLGAGPAEVLPALAGALAPHAAYLVPLLLAALLAVLSRRDARLWLTGAVVLGGIAAWACTGSLPRFLTPTLGVVLALAAAAARSVAGRWAARLALVATAVTGFAFDLAELRRVGGLGVLTRSPEAERTWIANNPLPAFAAARILPADARVLFVGEPRGFGFPRRFVAPSQHDVSPLRALLETSRSPAEVCGRLRGAGFSHLLINRGELGRLAGRYPVAPWRDGAGFRRWNAFLASLGPPVVECGGVAIYPLP